MTEDQRKQAAAQRCNDVAAELSETVRYIVQPEDVARHLALELDKLAREVVEHHGSPLCDIARKHILPEPKPSPVERLATATTAFTDHLSATTLNGLIGQLGLKLVEVDPSDDQ